MCRMLVEFGYCRQDREPGAGSTFRVVVMRLGIAKVRHHAVAEVLRDLPAETLGRLRRRSMISGDDLPPLFGVEMAGHLGRAHQIAKQHRQMAAFAARSAAPIRPWMKRRREAERRRAFVTKFRAGSVVRAASRAPCDYRRSAFAAKLRVFGIFRCATLAAHRLTSRACDPGPLVALGIARA